MAGIPAMALATDRWYSMRSIQRNGDECVSPIWVMGSNAIQSGKGGFDLHFWHADDSAGVQDRTYALRVLQREAGYLLAERRDDPAKPLILLTQTSVDGLRLQYKKVPETGLQEWAHRPFRTSVRPKQGMMDAGTVGHAQKDQNPTLKIQGTIKPQKASSPCCVIPRRNGLSPR